ncbi:hypothetical protein [Chryseobacterium daeguense]|uniref:hypothetical protein n=1 Tax=Chryseobacterium daeguense TaxID=412438 RepID=UPI00041E16E4|nr:hypothetical protein [Chryseobacterium daeguense]
MRNVFFTVGMLICLSFATIQKSEFLGNWNVVDSYNIEQISMKDVALHKIVKKKIVDQKSQIIFTADSIMIKQNGSISDRSKVKDLKKINKDSIVFKFDDHIASFKLKNHKSGILTVDKKAVFHIEK